MNFPLKSIISETSRSLKIPLSASLVIEVVSNFQIISIILDNAFSSSIETNDFPTRFARSIASFISSIDEFDTPDNDAFLKTIWICFVLYLLVLVLAIVFVTVIRSKSPIAIRKVFFTIISLAYLIHSRVVFFIIEYFFVGLIGSYNSCGESDDNSFQCQTIWLGFTILFCVINFIIAFFKEMLLYDVNKSKRNKYAVKNNMFHRLVLLHKTLAIMVFFLVQDPFTTREINAAVNIALLFISLIILYIKLPFYSITVLKASIITTGTALSFSIISVLGVAGVSKEVIGVIWVGLTPLIMKALLTCLNLISERIMHGHFRSPERAIHFVMLLKAHNFGYIAKSIFPMSTHVSAIVSNGILVHKKANMDIIRDSKNKKEYEEKIYNHILDKINQVLDKNPASELLLLFMAKIYFKKLENIPKAITLLKRVEALSLSIPIKTSIDAFNMKMMETHIREESESNSDKLHLVDYFKERALANSVKEDIQLEVQKQLEFWEEIRKDRTNVRRVIELADAIEETSTKIHSKWKNQIHGYTTQILNPLIMYSAYLEIIKEHSDEARKMLQRFWNLSNNPHRSQMLDVYSDEDAVILVSIEKSSHGIILEASASTQTLFEREKNKIIGQNLNVLLPSIVGENFLKLLEKYSRKPTGRLDYRVKTYCKTSFGEFFEADIQIKLFPEVSRQVKVMIIFSKLSIPKPLIIVDSDANIRDCTESLKQTFDFGPTTTTGAIVNMQRIAPGFERINDAFNYIYDQANFSKDNQGKSPTAEHPVSPVKLFQMKNYGHDDKSPIATPQNANMKLEPTRAFSAERRKPLMGVNQLLALEDLAQDQYKDICDEYMEGSKLKFNLLQRNFENSEDDTFEVKIIPFEFNEEVFKIIILTLAEERRNASKVLIKGIVSAEAEVETLFSEFAADFPEEKERSFEEVGQKKFHTHLTAKPEGSSIGIDRRLSRMTENTEDRTRFPQVKTIQSMTPVKKEGSAPEVLMDKVKFENRENSVSSTSSRTVASIRALKTLFNKSQSYTLAKKTTIAIFVVMIFMGALAVTNFILSHTAIQQIQTGVITINYASLRLSQSLRMWQCAARFFLRKVKLRSGQIQSLKDLAYTSGNGVLAQNKLLLDQISQQKDKNFARELMEGDVNLWMLYDNQTVSGQEIDTFEAANSLSNNILRVANTTDDVESAINSGYIQFVANNSGNDYLVASEDVIVSTQEMLRKLITKNISTLQLVLGLQISALIILCFCLVVSLRTIFQSYRKLFRALVKIDEKNVSNRMQQIQQMKILLFEDLDTKKFGTTALEIMRPNEKETFKVKAKAKSIKKIGFQKIEDHMNMKGLLSHLMKYIGFSLLVIQVITILFIVSLLKSISNFRDLETVNNQLTVTTRVAYQSSAVLSIFYVEMVWRNDTTMMVRNENPAVQLQKSVEAISNVNNDLVSVFSDGEGIMDPLIKDILDSTICKYLSSDATLQGYCDNATAGGQLGMLSVNSKFYMTSNYYMTQFLSNPTYDNAKSFIDTFISIVRPAAETIEAGLEFINNHILTNFNQSIYDFDRQVSFLHLGILFAIIFSTIVILKVGISRLKSLDMCRGIILRVMPLQVLLEDKAVTFYLNRHFIGSNNALSKML